MRSDFNCWKRLATIVKSSELLMEGLAIARQLALPNWWIVGGAIRDVVWQGITNRPTGSICDLDLVYFDATSPSKDADDRLEDRLGSVGGVPWSIKNQARMHIFDREVAYSCVEEAIFYFPETVSCVGIKMTAGGELIIINLFGFSDLLGMIFRPTPGYLRRASFSSFVERVHTKGWVDKWPELRVAPWRA